MARKKVEKEQEIEEEVKTKEEALVAKEEVDDIVIGEDKLEKIAEERIKQKSLPKEEKNIINKEIFKNIIIAILVVIYFGCINIGYYNIKETTYVTDLQVFSGLAIIFTVFVFEKAYKKDSGKIAVLGIEMLVISIFTLLTNYIYTSFYTKYPYIVNTVSMIFGIYFTGKSIIIYNKMKKEALKKISDVRKIIKK